MSLSTVKMKNQKLEGLNSHSITYLDFKVKDDVLVFTMKSKHLLKAMNTISVKDRQIIIKSILPTGVVYQSSFLIPCSHMYEEDCSYKFKNQSLKLVLRKKVKLESCFNYKFVS